MREVPHRVVRLFTRRAVLAWWAISAAGGLGLTWLPLLDQPGYELSMGLTLAMAILGGGISISAARVPRTPVSAIAVLLLLSALPALLLATLRTWLGTPCNAFSSVAFVPVLLVPSALLVAAVGSACARLRGWRAGLAYTGVALASLVPTLWPILSGPQVFAFNHLGGYVPGPLYDEELLVTAPLLWFRAATVLLALGLAAALARRGLLAAVLLAAFFVLELSGTRLGFRMTDDALAKELGGKLETGELVLFYPSSFSDEDVSRVLGDVRFRFHQNVTFFGEPPPGKVRVWWHRSAADKQRLVGAKHTHFAKPWRREVHVHGLTFPHPVIKHELVHAMAAPWGAGPFGVAATTFGLVPHVGVIEGFAVAADNPLDELTLHEWAAAMKKKDLLPGVAKLMTPNGFYGAPPSRAYTAAGSFLRYLADTHGKEKLRRLYRDGDFEAAFGTPLEKLALDYESFLDAVPLEAEAVNQAFGRFKRGSLFDRPCAREVGALSAEASAAEPQKALALLSRCRALQPEEPSHVLSEAQALRRLSKDDAARALLDAELKRLESEPSPWADAALLRADLAQEDGDLQTATTLWQKIIERQVSPAMDRTARVRLEGKELEAVRRYFEAGSDEVKLYLLREALLAEPGSVPAKYLLARRLAQAGEAAAALPWLQQLLEGPLPESLKKETARLAVEAGFKLGRCDVVERWATRGDWTERCAFAYPAPAK